MSTITPSVFAGTARSTWVPVEEPTPADPWWVVRALHDRRIFTAYRDKAEAVEHADRMQVRFGQRPAVLLTDGLPGYGGR